MSFTSYPKYKGSGVKWLGRVPEHWRVLSLRHVTFKKCDGPFGSGLKSEHYEDAGIRVVRLQNIRNGYFDDSDAAFIGEGYYRDELNGHDVQFGDVLIAGLGDDRNTVGRACVAPSGIEPAMVKADCFRFRLIERVANPDFVAAQLTAGSFADAGLLSSGSTRSRIPLSIMASRKVAMPGLTEQSSIMAFLDPAKRKIDALIVEQRRLIELLKEKRQAVIFHAVTKGINPDAPMKSSGFDWLGEVPAHWRVLHLSRVTQSACDGPFGSGLKSKHYSEEGVRVIRLQNIRCGHFDATDSAFIDTKHYEQLGDHSVVFGDLLVAGLGDDRNVVGRACVAPAGIELAMVKADCFRFRLLQPDANSEFVAAQLTAGAAADAGRLATGSTRSRISLSKMGSRTIALPPVNEQIEILDFLAGEMTRYSDIEHEAACVIDLLQERLSALISAAVTGKIDVRQPVAECAA